MEKLVKGQRHSAELEGRVVAVALRSADAFTAVEFLHGIPTADFVEGIRTDIGRAFRGKLIDESERDRVTKGVAGWFAFLGERGVVDGDQLYHRGRPTGVRTVYFDNAGKKRMDINFPGAPPTRTLIATYLAPGGELRQPLVRSLFDEPDAS